MPVPGVPVTRMHGLSLDDAAATPLSSSAVVEHLFRMVNGFLMLLGAMLALYGSYIWFALPACLPAAAPARPPPLPSPPGSAHTHSDAPCRYLEKSFDVETMELVVIGVSTTLLGAPFLLCFHSIPVCVDIYICCMVAIVLFEVGVVLDHHHTGHVRARPRTIAARHALSPSACCPPLSWPRVHGREVLHDRRAPACRRGSTALPLCGCGVGLVAGLSSSA